MARQSGDILITGTIENLCFYKMEGKYYVRAKSSLKGKRVKADPAFKKTMYYAGMLANASKIASVVYKKLNEEQKAKGLYRKMTGEAMQLLKTGATYEETLVQLHCNYFKQEKNDIVSSSVRTLLQRIAVDSVIDALFAEYIEMPDFVPSAPP